MDTLLRRFSQIQVNNDLYDYFLLFQLNYIFLEIRDRIFYSQV